MTRWVGCAGQRHSCERVTQLLERGHNVAATTRSIERVNGALGGANTSRLLPIQLDLTDEARLAAEVQSTKDRFGDLDVVVNNAGCGFLGAVEEITDGEVRQIFGVWNLLRVVMLDFRAARAGHIITASSILGLTTLPARGLNSAGKFALEGSPVLSLWISRSSA